MIIRRHIQGTPLSSGNEHFRIQTCQSPKVLCYFQNFGLRSEDYVCMCLWVKFPRSQAKAKSVDFLAGGNTLFDVHKDSPDDSNAPKMNF